MMENIIYNELVCRGYSVDIGVVENEQKRTERKGRDKAFAWSQGFFP